MGIKGNFAGAPARARVTVEGELFRHIIPGEKLAKAVVRKIAIKLPQAL